jgi:[ribosomal protein S18]-alanine N-acetyltransferase
MKPDNCMSENKNDFLIRDFCDEDFPAVSQVWENTGVGGAHRGDVLEVILNTINHGGKLLILENKNTKHIAGTAWLTNDFRRIYLHHFCIKTEFQGNHLSHMLCEECIRLAKQLNLQIKLEVHRNNSKAISLYEKHGFKFLGDYLVYIIRDSSK